MFQKTLPSPTIKKYVTSIFPAKMKNTEAKQKKKRKIHYQCKLNTKTV